MNEVGTTPPRRVSFRGTALALLWTAWIVATLLFFLAGPWWELRAAVGGDLPEELPRAGAATVLSRMDSATLALYRSFQVLDLLWAGLGSLVFALTARAAARSARIGRLAALPAVLLFLVELVENLLLRHATRLEDPSAVLDTATKITRLKFAVAPVAYVVTLVALGVIAIAALRRRRSRGDAILG